MRRHKAEIRPVENRILAKENKKETGVSWPGHQSLVKEKTTSTGKGKK